MRVYLLVLIALFIHVILKISSQEGIDDAQHVRLSRLLQYIDWLFKCTDYANQLTRKKHARSVSQNFRDSSGQTLKMKGHLNDCFIVVGRLICSLY